MLAPKIAALQLLHAAGLPVPASVALTDPHDADPARWSAIESLLRGGPVIVRTALHGEDRDHTAAAGLGTSIPDCHDLAAVRRALARIHDSLADRWLRAHLGDDPRAQVLVQRQIRGPWLAVVAQGLTRHVEIHPTRRPVDPHARTEPHLAAAPSPALATPRRPLAPRPAQTASREHRPPPTSTAPRDPLATSPAPRDPLAAAPAPRDPLAAAPSPAPREPLAAGTSPALTAPLDLLPDHFKKVIAPLCDRITAALPSSPHGLDLELAADDTGAVWVVQARPLTRPLHPEWHAFAAAAADDLPKIGLWTLDAEHNPAPLSPAHAGLIRRLAARRPDLVTARVLAGWLYEPTHEPSPPPLTAQQALRALQLEHIPAARAWLTDFDAELPAADAPILVDLLDRACDHFLKILATHAALRVPAVAAPPALRCLQDRRAHLDVLPAAWDIASPALADLSPTWPEEPVPTTTSPDDATRLRELDDHLFALGLAPLRRFYLRAAALLDVPPADIFLLPPDLLQTTLRAPTRIDLAALRRVHAAQADLYPPLQILNGLPVPAAARTWLQGLAIGPPYTGPVHARRDLASLLADPIPRGAVLAIPALTAQAAVALHALDIKAVCCEHGGAMSHAALMARELGLSALVGCRGCTTLPPGTRVHLDTRTARLRPL